MELYNNIQSVLSKKGINLVVGNIYDLMAIWKQWYRGSVNDFHYYTERVNGQECKKERLTMNMPKKICEDISKLLWTEKTRIGRHVDGAGRAWRVFGNAAWLGDRGRRTQAACKTGAGAGGEHAFRFKRRIPPGHQSGDGARAWLSGGHRRYLR